MIRRSVVIVANADATREALRLLASARVDVTLANPAPADTLPAHEATTGRRHRLAGAALSDREIEVLQLISKGNTNDEIGARLYLARNTISSHTKRIFRKLGAVDRAHAVIVGLRAGLIEVPA